MTSQLPTAIHHKPPPKSATPRCRARARWIGEPLRLVGLTLNQHRLARVLTRRCTPFDSFIKLLRAEFSYTPKNGPPLHCTARFQPEAFRRAESIGLANFYDRAQRARGDKRRALRL